MVRFAPLALALLLAGPAVAAAPSTSLKAAFTGTIVSTYPDGRQGRLWLSEDGSYKASGRRGDPSNGTWKLKGSQVCLKQSKPIPTPFAFCTPTPSSKDWTAKAVSGEPIKVHLAAGGRPG